MRCTDPINAPRPPPTIPARRRRKGWATARLLISDASQGMVRIAARAANTPALRISALNPPRLAFECVQMQPQAAVCADIRHRRLRIEQVDRLCTRRRAANGDGLVDRSIPEVDRRAFK